jgi:hypothetical protein
MIARFCGLSVLFFLGRQGEVIRLQRMIVGRPYLGDGVLLRLCLASQILRSVFGRGSKGRARCRYLIAHIMAFIFGWG